MAVGPQAVNLSSSIGNAEDRCITHFESAIEPGVTLPVDCIQTRHKGRPLWSVSYTHLTLPTKA